MMKPLVARAPRRWRPSPLLSASLGVHTAAVTLAALRPSQWPWAAAGIGLNHVVLTASGLWPRCSLLGPNWTRLPPSATACRQVAVTIDDGPDPLVTPQVLAILQRYRACATFFCIGERVRQYPDLSREIVRLGHALENHSQRHPWHFSLLGPRAMAAEISAAQETIAAIVGDTPQFFRAPAGLRNPFLDPVLTRLGLRLASWTRRGFDTVTREPAVVLRRLQRGLSAGDIVLLHDGHAARAPSGAPVIQEVLPALLDSIAAAGLLPGTLRAALP